MSTTSTRINVTLSEQNYEDVKAIAAESGLDMSEYIRTALRVFNHVQRERKKGRRIYVGMDAKIEHEIVIP